jgi:hypothetical protein
MPETTDPAVRKARGTVTGAPLAEVSATWERPLGSDPRDPVPPGELAYATEDVLVRRPELGENAYTFVAAGDRLPTRAELGDVPAAPAPSAAAKVHKPKG